MRNCERTVNSASNRTAEQINRIIPDEINKGEVKISARRERRSVRCLLA
jgi:hypothetical protein